MTKVVALPDEGVELRNEFFGYYQLGESEFATLWREATFVFDTNVLLNLYRYSAGARVDLLNVMSGIASRIWIPHQVALEFQRNRPTVAADQLRRYEEVRDLVSGAGTRLAADLGNKGFAKWHSAIETESLRTSIDQAVTPFLAQLEQSMRGQPDVYSPDDIRSRLDSIFAGKIGPAPDQDWLDKLYAEGRERYKRKQPPGYEDAFGPKAKSEDDVYTYRGLSISPRYGDLILWKQLLEAAKNESRRHIILVTEEKKEDWWWVCDSKGKKTIGPRPELVEEIKLAADVQGFHMYDTEGFLKYARQHLHARVDDDSLRQVRDVSAAMQFPQIPLFRRERRHAVVAAQRYLAKTQQVVVSQRVRGSPTFLANRPGSTLPLEVNVVYQRDPNVDRDRLRGLIHGAERKVQQGVIEGMLLVYVGSDHEIASALAHQLQGKDVRRPELDILVGGLHHQADGSTVFLPSIHVGEQLDLR